MSVQGISSSLLIQNQLYTNPTSNVTPENNTAQPTQQVAPQLGQALMQTLQQYGLTPQAMQNNTQGNHHAHNGGGAGDQFVQQLLATLSQTNSASTQTNTSSSNTNFLSSLNSLVSSLQNTQGTTGTQSASITALNNSYTNLINSIASTNTQNNSSNANSSNQYPTLTNFLQTLSQNLSNNLASSSSGSILNTIA